MQRKSPVPINNLSEVESKEIPDKSSDSDSDNDDPRELVQHCAFHMGLPKVKLDQAPQKGSYDSIAKQLEKLGDASAKSTAGKVAVVAIAKGLGLEFTAEEAALALSHGPMHTGGYGKDGSVVKPVLKELEDYAVQDDNKTMIITLAKLEEYRQDRFKANRETNPSTCCTRMFGKTASDGEFGSFNRLYPTIKTTINGKEETAHTLADVKEFYLKPFKAGQKVIDRVAKNKLEELLANDSSVEQSAEKKCRR